MRSSLSAWGRVAGSGHFFTRWSWLATLPVAVTVLGGYDSATTAHDRAVGVGLALAVHVLLGGVGLVAAAAERRAATTRARTVTVVVGVLVLGLLRPVLAAVGAAWSGLVLYESPFWARVVTNLVAVAVALALIARVTVTVQARRSAADRLRAVLTALDDQRRTDARTADDLTAELLTSTRTAIRAHLPDARIGTDDPVRAAELLRAFSEQVVRPLSHQLFDDPADPAPGPAAHLAAPTGGTPTRARQRTADRTGPGLLDAAPVGGTAAVYAALWVPYTITHLDPARGARLVLGTFLLATVGNWLVDAVAHRVATRWRPVALVLGYVLVGDVLVTAAGATAVLPGNAGTLLVTGVVAYPAFALSVAAGRAGLRHLLVVEEALAQAVSESRALSLAEHNRLLLARHRVARLLHADVQAQCVQAALALTRGNDGPSWSQALAGVVALLDDPGRDGTARDNTERNGTGRDGTGPDDRRHGSALPATGRPPTDPAPGPTSVADQLGALLSAWRHALDLTVQVEDDVWPVLDADPARTELVLDAVSEGLTNAARHAAEPRATVGLRAVAQGAGRVTVQIESPGVLTGAGAPGDAAGYGLDQLRARALDLTLSQVGALVRLQVTVP
ncbi:MAG: hypothetical protein KJ792_10440 [Actinobacteria bacterium]|nr:hypothetical protein [Actinomycetota bacterium]